MHPFSDQSGVAFFDASTTVVTAVKMPLSSLHKILDEVPQNEPLAFNDVDEAQQSLNDSVISSLLTQGFIEKVTHQS